MPYDASLKGDAVHEDLKDDATNRRNISGNNLFENLGDPIKNIILQVEREGKDVDETTLELLQHITVKQLAKIFDMLGQGEDADTILAWLKRRARKNKAGQDDWKEERKKLIETGARRNPVEFYKAIEEENAKKQEEYDQMAEDRAQLRLAKAKQREKDRSAFFEKMEEAKKAMEDEGVWWKAVDVMPEKDKNAINNAFEKFATKNSEFDNSDMDHDGEWWKRDAFRRDWERNKAKGKKWTAVCEGAKDKATEPELAVREEFYRGNDWWKADKYKGDWEGTKDATWWKEEPYIKDWQQNKHEGARWTAADEESGLEGEGTRYPCSPEEARHREDWYKANGPRGVVKKWNAATEGDPEKCSVPEKHAREEYYRNGDWWKTDGAREDFKDRGLDCDALTFAAKPLDSDWWKQEPYRSDFFKNGPKGRQWTAVNEAAAVDKAGDQKPAPDLEKDRREAWYKNNWWKQPEYKDDWKKNGRTGNTKWRAPTEEEAKKGGYPKPVGDDERRKREEWYKNDDDEWWKAPRFIEDYFQKGPEGRHWPARTKDDGMGGRALENPATRDEQGKREDWYRSNWWKQPKYTDDFWKNGPLGAAWTGKGDDQNHDKEWWKQPAFIDNWQRTMKPKSQPQGQEWWKQPEYVEDYQLHGPKGRKWPAATETAGIEGTGIKNPCTADDKDYRQRWYADNWWRAPRCAMDWAKHGPKGEMWRAASKASAEDPKIGASKEPCTDKEARGRVAFYKPIGDMWRACGEELGFAGKAAENPCTSADALSRDEWYRTNWWKAPEYVEDWKTNKGSGKKWPAGCEPSGKAGNADGDPCAAEEKQKRDDWYRNNADNEWWQEPQYCEDWGQNGPDGNMWTADARGNANRSGGKEHPCPEGEKKQREAWYKDNWWKTPHCYDDWKKHGKSGPECGRERPLQMDRTDPETIGDGWWKKPEYIEDWLNNDRDGKMWTAADPLAAASGMGHKKPAEDPEKDKREKWYRDNWWKAPTCSDDWAKAGDKRWPAATPDASRNQQGDKDFVAQPEKDKREDWYRKHGDSDGWWKRPEFIADYQESGPSGKKWTAASSTAGALGLGHTNPASTQQKKKREDWYKDNAWKAPKIVEDWAKGPQSSGAWKDGASPDEAKKRDAWYKQNMGSPAAPDEKDKREAWYRKHPVEPSGAQLLKREDWYRGQLSDDDKGRRMDWLRERGAKDKRIQADELADALTAINEGQPPTEKQVQAIRDAIQKNRDGQKDDFDDASGSKRGVADDEEEPITREEFFRAVADTNFYIAPDKDELEMQAEEEKVDQEKEEMGRQEEELAYLALDAEEEQKKRPENWQRKYRDPEQTEWWKRPDVVENFHRNPEDPDALWRKEEETGRKPCSDADAKKREDWYRDNWWKDPKYSTEWRRDGEMGDNWKKAARPEEDEEGAPIDDDDTPEATEEQLAEREKWFRNAKAPERQAAIEDEKWKRPDMVEDFQNGGDDWKRDAKPEEIPEREKWMKDNWWKAPKHIEEFKKAAKEPAAEPADTQSWKRAAAAPEQEEVPEATPQQVADRMDFYRKVLEPFVGEKLDEPFEGEKIEDQTPFLGEKLKDQEPFVGEKIPDGNLFLGEKLTNEDPFSGEKMMTEDPFLGEKLTDETPFSGEKFVNEDDDPDDPDWEAPGDEEMQPEDERIEEEEEPDNAEEAMQEEDKAWNDEDDEDAADEEEEEEEEEEEDDGDNEHQDDEDLEAELEAAFEEQDTMWEEDEEDEDIF
ncbi:putative Unc104-like kinesin [Diplonema papillatum]|nr:putative Unc104-like kinesin [Diplonema papillatum]